LPRVFETDFGRPCGTSFGGDAVEMWMQNRPEVDVYPSFELYTERDVELAAQELEFTPLFTD